jgi:hypothetical protein
MSIPNELKPTPMMQHFFDLRFNRGLKQREIATLLRIGQPAVSRREQRIVDRFFHAGLPEPVPPGRNLFVASTHSF